MIEHKNGEPNEGALMGTADSFCLKLKNERLKIPMSKEWLTHLLLCEMTFNVYCWSSQITLDMLNSSFFSWASFAVKNPGTQEKVPSSQSMNTSDYSKVVLKAKGVTKAFWKLRLFSLSSIQFYFQGINDTFILIMKYNLIQWTDTSGGSFLSWAMQIHFFMAKLEPLQPSSTPWAKSFPSPHLF